MLFCGSVLTPLNVDIVLRAISFARSLKGNKLACGQPYKLLLDVNVNASEEKADFQSKSIERMVGFSKEACCAY